jgi:hypothetical protein
MFHLRLVPKFQSRSGLMFRRLRLLLTRRHRLHQSHKSRHRLSRNLRCRVLDLRNGTTDLSEVARGHGRSRMDTDWDNHEWTQMDTNKRKREGAVRARRGRNHGLVRRSKGTMGELG